MTTLKRTALLTSYCISIALVPGVEAAAAPPAAKQPRSRWVPAAKPLVWRTLNEPGCGGAMTALAVSPFNSRHLLVAGDMLGVGLSTDGGDHWQSTTGFKSWEIADFTWHPTDPKTVWVGTMSGPYLSRDGGRTWHEKRGGFPPAASGQYSAPIQKVLYDPADPNHLLAFGGSSRFWQSPGKPLWGAIWESRNGGENWSRLTTITPDGASSAPGAEGRNITCALYAPGAAGRKGVLYITASDAGFLTSADNGRTWSRRVRGLPPGAGYTRFALHPTVPGTLWLAVGSYKSTLDATQRTPGGIWKTSDGGLNWRESSQGLGRHVQGLNGNTTSHYDGVGVAPSDPRVLYTNDGAWSTGVNYRSGDGGVTWQPVASKTNLGSDSNDPSKRRVFQLKTAYPAGLSMATFTVDPKSANVAYAFNSEFISRTRDGGKTWDDATAYRAPKSGPDAWIGRGYSGLCSQNFRFSPTRPGDALLIGMDAGKLWRSQDNLQTWTFHGKEPWPWGGGNDAVYAGKAIYATYGQFGQYLGIGRTLDDGKTWTTLGGKVRGLPETNSSGGVPLGIYAHKDRPADVWTTIGGALYHSADAGETWGKTSLDGWKGWIAGDPNDPAHFYVTSDKGLYETVDSGASFVPLGGPKAAGRITLDTLGRVYVAAHRSERGGLWRREKGTWTRLLDDPFVANVAVDPANPSRLAVATNDDPYHDHSSASGVWLSADAGKTWRQANNGLAMTRGYAIAFDPWTPGRLVFGSFGRGYFVTQWPKNYVPSTTPKSYVATADDNRFASAIPPPAPAPAALRVGSLKNGDMSAGTQTPTDWRIAWTGRGKLSLVRDAQIYKAGPAALRLDTGGADAMGQAAQTIDAPAGTRLSLSGAVKSQGKVKVNVAIQSFTADWKALEFKQVKYAQNDSEWTSFTGDVALPPGAARAAVTLLVEGTGKAWLDEVKLTANGKPVNSASAAVPAAETQNPLVPSPGYWPEYPKGWRNLHEDFVAKARRDASKIKVVFLGDSITQSWDKALWQKHFAPAGAVNFGIGGDGVQQLQWRVDHGELDPLTPKLIVLMIGINNFWGKKGTSDEIAQGTAKLVKTLREKQPQSKILLLGILPAIESPTDGTRVRIKAINAQYAKIADGRSVRFLDIGNAFLEPDGRISKAVMGDYLHPTSAGYQRYLDALLPTFEEMRK
ncbi:MAG: hypothetical protein H7Z41_14280 [Cytophagales bacterium]|nr:hypothetical protein [Armatimonadota bacterium]